ncbi:MAG TPA: hypothetical protein VJ302_14785 [Blastocatellia bacterium]|nr:hypothetical protein [Blastocatellia bacterium]
MFHKIVISVLVLCAPAVAMAQSVKQGFTGEFRYNSLELNRKPPYFLRGDIINNTDRNWKTATFQVFVYDKDGNRLRDSSALDNNFTISNLKRGEKRQLGPTDQGQLLWLKHRTRPSRFEIIFLNGVFNVDYEVALVEPKASNSLNFQDERIAIQWSFNKRMVSLWLTNKTETPIKIDWDRIAYVDIKGIARKVMRQGVTSVSSNNRQLPTIVHAKGMLKDQLLPTGNLVYNPEESGALTVKPIFPDGEAALAYQGKSFWVYIPVEIEGKTQNYLFVFKVTNVRF